MSEMIHKDPVRIFCKHCGSPAGFDILHQTYRCPHCGRESGIQETNNFINRLQKAVEDVIKSSEMEGRYMQFREILDEEKAEGKAEDIIDLLSDLGIVPEKLREKIFEEKDLDVLRFYLKNAAAAKSIPEFESRINEKA